MRRAVSWAVFGLALLGAALLGACTSEEPGTETPTPTPTATSSVSPTATVTPEPTVTPTTTATPEATPTATNVPLEGVHPSGTRTGIEDVDAVIAAVEEGDLEALMALVEYQPAECVPPPAQGLGGPPLCEEGEPAGTVVEVFPAAACEGYLERDARQLIEAAADTPGLYAVLEGPAAEREEVWWPLGDYIVVFASPEGRQPSGQSLVIEDGRIVRAQLGCFSPDELMTYRGEPLPAIIAPPSP